MLLEQQAATDILDDLFPNGYGIVETRKTPKKKKPAPKERKVEKLIHISASCPYFEIHENVAEAKAVSRLTAIRNMYSHELGRRSGSGKLVVKTGIVNPTMF